MLEMHVPGQQNDGKKSLDAVFNLDACRPGRCMEMISSLDNEGEYDRDICLVF